MLRIKYTKDANGNVIGCRAEDPTAGYKREITTPVNGGMWIDGKQVEGTCDFSLTGSAANQRRQLRTYINMHTSYRYAVACAEMGV